LTFSNEEIQAVRCSLDILKGINGFSVMYFDTGGYIERVLSMNLGFGRSFFSGVFLWAASSSGWLFFVPTVIQALFAIWLIQLLLHFNF